MTFGRGLREPFLSKQVPIVLTFGSRVTSHSKCWVLELRRSKCIVTFFSRVIALIVRRHRHDYVTRSKRKQCMVTTLYCPFQNCSSPVVWRVATNPKA